jgi:hypothetical protein
VEVAVFLLGISGARLDIFSENDGSLAIVGHAVTEQC